jgi:protease PrsW
MNVIISFILAVVPALFILRYYYKQDKKKPEPKGVVFKLFFMGMLGTIPILFLEALVSQFKGLFVWHPLALAFFEAFVVAALCEEYIKYSIVKKYAYHDIHFDEEMDGIVYAVVASLGFACVENIIFVINHNFAVALVRGFTSVPLHALAAGLMGYYIGCAKFADSRKAEKLFFFKGLAIAILIHGLYDFIIFSQPVFGEASTLAIFILLFFTFKDLKGKIKKAVIEDAFMQRS